MKPTLRRLVLALAAMVLVLGGIELLARGAWQVVVLRAVAARGASLSSVGSAEALDRFTPNECSEFEYAQYDPGSYLPGTPKWELCANSLGFRGPEFSVAREPRTYRVVCMGDSNTLGQGVAYDDTFCNRFGERLKTLMTPRGIQVETIDAGIWGNSSYQGLILYEQQVRSWHADLILVGYGANDRGPFAGFGHELPDRYVYRRPGTNDPGLILIDVSGSYLEKLVRYALRARPERRLDANRRLDEYQGDVPFAARRATPIEYRENLELLLGSIDRDGSAAILLGIAVVEREYRSVLERAAADHGVPFIATWEILAELEPAIFDGEIFREERERIERWLKPEAREIRGPWSRLLTIDGGHPSIIGHRIIADEIYRAFEQMSAGRPGVATSSPSSGRP
jgi:lysophospholipase L1-like esterase